MASNQYWDNGLPNSLIPGLPYPGDLLYWDNALPIEGLQSTDIYIVGNAIVGSHSVPTGGVVTLAVFPLVGNAIVGGHTVPTGGAVQASTITILGTAITGAHSVPAGGVVALQSIPIVGDVIVGSHSVPVGGTVSLQVLPIVGDVIVGGSTVFTDGVVSLTAAPGAPTGSLGSGFGTGVMPIPRPNEYDDYLKAQYPVMELAMMRTVNAWGLNGIPPCVAQDPDAQFGAFHVAQDLRRNFFVRGSITTPTTVSGNNVVVQFQVPVGYFGLLLGVYNIYTGTGFVQGSGDIVWRIKIGGRWLRNFGNQLFSQGDLANPFPLMASDTLMPGELVQFIVSVPNTSGGIQVGASNILCGLQGWFYPLPTRSIMESDPQSRLTGRKL